MKSTFFSTLLISGLFLLISTSVFAQRGQGQMQDQRRQMEARRVAFLTEQLELTPREAQQFWPVYNEFNSKRNEMMLRHRSQRGRDISLDELGEAELLQIADLEIANMEEMAALRRQYHERFKTVLSPLKLAKLYDAERDFNRNLLRESRGAQRGGRGRN